MGQYFTDIYQAVSSAMQGMAITFKHIYKKPVSLQFPDERQVMLALPERARVVVSLNNPDVALVEEEGIVTLQKGVNKVDFSWRGVNIDSASIQVRALNNPERVVVLNTSYPPNENALIWEVASPGAQEERFRISYLLSGLNRDIVYKAVAEPDEKALKIGRAHV